MFLLHKDFNNQLVASNRFSFREKNQFNGEPTPTTTQPEIEFGGRLFKSTNVEDATRDGGFGSRQTTTGSLELQKIEDD